MYVKGIGPTPARIMLVGEAPGDYETRAGEPFVGPAGKLLNSILSEAGISRLECYITNVAKTQPSKNDFTTFFTDVKRTKPTAELVAFINDLRTEIQTVDPNVIVAVGDNAMWALTNKRGIMKYRGSVLPCTLVPGKKVVCTIHPAAILRGGWVPWRYVAPVDFRKVLAEAQYPELRRVERDFLIGASLVEILDYLANLEKSEFCSFDIETRHNKIITIALSDTPNRAICIPFTRGLTNYWTLEQEAQIWRALQRVLGNPNIKKVGQNLQYDILMLSRQAKLVIRGVWLDTMIAHHELYPETTKEAKDEAVGLKSTKGLRGGKGLGFIASLWINEPYWKDEGKGTSVRDVDLWNYNCKDAACTLEIAHAIEKELRAENLWDAFQETLSFTFPLMAMTLKGVKFDFEKQKELITKYETKEKEYQATLNEAVGYELNISSNKQMVKFLYMDLGLPIRTGKSGSPTADEEALLLLRRDHSKYAPVFDTILFLRKVAKLRSTYLEMETDPVDKRIRCSYDVAGTTTWRLSSRESIFGGGTNLQNIPKQADESSDIRKLFKADDGFFMFSIDLSQAEARVVAWLSDDEQKMREYAAGEDVHTKNASRIFHIPIDVLQRLKEEEPKKFKDMRKLGKVVEHAGNYDQSFIGLMRTCLKNGVFLSSIEAKQLLAAGNNASPMRQHWHNRVREELAKSRRLTTPFGKRRYFGEMWGDDLFRQAYAFVPQSTVGQLALRGMMRLFNHFDFDDVQLLLEVHDEVVGQCRIEKPELVLEAKTLMEETIEVRSRPLTIPSELKVGWNWGEMKEIKNNDVLAALK